MSADTAADQERTDAELTDFDSRPADCACAEWSVDACCWPCYRDGFAFDDPNPNARD